MATEQELTAALRKADAAGDVTAARALANEIRRVRARSTAGNPDVTAKAKRDNPELFDPNYQYSKPSVAGAVGKAAIGVPDVALNLARNAVAAPLAGVGGALMAPFAGADMASDFIGATQRVIGGEPFTESGKNALMAISYPFEKIAQGGDVAGGFVAEKTGSPALGAAVNTGIQAAPMLLAKGRGKTPDPVHPAVEQARALGYRLQPSQIVDGKPIGSAASILAERGAGKAALPAELSIKNAPLTTKMVAEEIGLKKGESITPAAIDKLRKESNKPFEALEKLDKRIDPDVDFFYDLSQLVKESRSTLRGDKPDARLVRLADEYRKAKDGVPIREVMEEVRRLRFDSRANYAAEKPATKRLGEAQRKVADSLESMIERQVADVDPAAVQAWRNARVQRARLELVDDALKGTEIDPKVFAKALRDGQPLTGKLREIAEVANNFPQVMQSGATLGSKSGIGLLDVAMSVPTVGLWSGGRWLALKAASKEPGGFVSTKSRASKKPVGVGVLQSTASQREGE